MIKLEIMLVTENGHTQMVVIYHDSLSTSVGIDYLTNKNILFHRNP